MELRELVEAMTMVEVKATARGEAIRQMVEAVEWGDQVPMLDDVMRAIEEREATAQTVVADGFALPHAVTDWEGTYRVVLGRSKAGVMWDIPGTSAIHLIVLLVVGKPCRKIHLELLAAVAELMQAKEFRDGIIAAMNIRGIERLVRRQVGIEAEMRRPSPPGVSPLNRTIIRQAIQLAEAVSAQALLLAVDSVNNIPWDDIQEWDGRLLIILAEPNEELPCPRPQTHLLDIPHLGLARTDRANLGLLMAAASGLLDESSNVVCVTGPQESHLDSVTVAKPEGRFHNIFSGTTTKRTSAVRPAVILRVVSLAIELSSEGREGRPVGTMFVVGDSRHVTRCTQQLVLNPFHGFSRSLRNVLDPSLAETIKEFAQIDGAFVISSDGTVLSAGTYLAPQASVTDLPSGLGTRHTTAAAITAHTRAVAVTVSQSTGTVTLFHNGTIVMTLERAARTRW